MHVGTAINGSSFQGIAKLLRFEIFIQRFKFFKGHKWKFIEWRRTP